MATVSARSGSRRVSPSRNRRNDTDCATQERGDQNGDISQIKKTDWILILKTTALIEKGDDGKYSIFTPDLKSTIIGLGDTVAEAKADFENSVREIKRFLAEDGIIDHELNDIEFEYKYDVASVFNEFNCINITQFAEFAGIYPSTMRQYARGLKRPSEKQTKKIEAALHLLGQRWQATCL
jgi:predicted RNase H-like HicB family nuclease